MPSCQHIRYIVVFFSTIESLWSLARNKLSNSNHNQYFTRQNIFEEIQRQNVDQFVHPLSPPPPSPPPPTTPTSNHTPTPPLDRQNENTSCRFDLTSPHETKAAQQPADAWEQHQINCLLPLSYDDNISCVAQCGINEYPGVLCYHPTGRWSGHNGARTLMRTSVTTRINTLFYWHVFYIWLRLDLDNERCYVSSYWLKHWSVVDKNATS